METEVNDCQDHAVRKWDRTRFEFLDRKPSFLHIQFFLLLMPLDKPSIWSASSFRKPSLIGGDGGA